MKNTVIFDLDGTLLNTLNDLADSVNFALDTCNYPKRTLEEIRTFVGNGVKILIKKSVPNGTDNKNIDMCLNIFKNHYSKNMQNKTNPYDGILELLSYLKENNIKTAVVSNKFDTAVKALSNNYFGKLISVAVGENEKAGIAKKPAPDSVFAVLKLLNSKKDESIYVGDSETDIKTAKNAGLISVGVTWGFRTREILINEGANYIINTPKELIKILNK